MNTARPRAHAGARRAAVARGPWCSPCRTRARPSGTWPTRPGSSRRSSSARFPVHRWRDGAGGCSSIRTTRRWGRGTRGPRGACSRDLRWRGARLRHASTRRWAGCWSRGRARPIAPVARRAPLDAVVLGTHHEEQHQELLLTDVQHAFGEPARVRPSGPRARAFAEPARRPHWRWNPSTKRWWRSGTPRGGATDSPSTTRHPGTAARGTVPLASRLVTNGEYLAFVPTAATSARGCGCRTGGRGAGGRVARTALLGGSGERAGRRMALTRGRRAIVADETVAHVSYYEADAYARWAGARLPTEGEWEHAAARAAPGEPSGNFADAGRLHPARATAGGGMFGDVWQWTRSAYCGYPGYQPSRRARSGSTTASS